MINYDNFKIKFTILCHNENEHIDIQEYLFKHDYCWSQGKIVQNPHWNYPTIIKNYRTNDKFGGRNLIHDDYRDYIKLNKNIHLINALSYLRKEKFKKISENYD